MCLFFFWIQVLYIQAYFTSYIFFSAKYSKIYINSIGQNTTQTKAKGEKKKMFLNKEALRLQNL